MNDGAFYKFLDKSLCGEFFLKLAKYFACRHCHDLTCLSCQGFHNTGWYPVGSTELTCPEKRLEKLWQEKYCQKTWEKVFKHVLERSDGVLVFPGTSFCFEQRKVHQNGQTGFWNLLLGAVVA